MTIGLVQFFDKGAGYRFIQTDDGGKGGLVQISGVLTAGLNTLSKGQRVLYDVDIGRNGKEPAINLSIAN